MNLKKFHSEFNFCTVYAAKMMSESFDPNRYDGERYDGLVDDEINKMKLALDSSRNLAYDNDDGIGNEEIINPQVAVRGLQFQRSQTASSSNNWKFAVFHNF